MRRVWVFWFFFFLSCHDVIQQRVCSDRILSDRRSEHQKLFFYSHYRVTLLCSSSPAQDDVVIGGIRAGEVTVGDVSRASLSLDGLMWGNVTLVVWGAPYCRLVPSVSGDVSLFVLRFCFFFTSVSTRALIISLASRFLLSLIPSPCCVIAPTFSAWLSEWRECN